MEIESKAILGLPIFTTIRGERLGQVQDYIFQPATKTVIAFVVKGAKPTKELLLPIEKMQSMGEGAITVTDADAFLTIEENPELNACKKRGANIVGMGVMTADGTFLGKVTAFTMNTKNGAVTALSLKDSGFRGLFGGLPQISTEEISVFGTDIILAKDSAKGIKEGKTTKAKSKKELRSNEIWNPKEIFHKGKTLKPPFFKDAAKEEATPPQTAPQKSNGKTSIGFKDSL